MKTYNNLWEDFISVSNFVRAYKDARKGKRKQESVVSFSDGWALKLYALRKDVMNGKFHTSEYKSMTVYEPKKRIVYKLPFSPDRIVQHAIVNILAPILENKFIADTYACIPGRGQIKASLRCMDAVRRNEYCLKCDIHHFYPSVNQKILSGMYHKIIKDVRFLKILDDVIFSFKDDNGCNVPIGNYLSQWSGNFYLSTLDNFVKRTLNIRDYIRYCDDFMLFSNDKKYLHSCRRLIQDFLQYNLQLKYSKADVFNVKQGVDFCGYRHFNNFVLLRKSTKLRQMKRILAIRAAVESRCFDKEKARSSIDSMLGWMCHAKTYKLKEKYGISELRRMVA